MEEINETKRLFFKKINKVDKSLAKLTKKKTKQIIKIRNGRRNITTNLEEIKRIIKIYCE